MQVKIKKNRADFSALLYSTNITRKHKGGLCCYVIILTHSQNKARDVWYVVGLLN